MEAEKSVQIQNENTKPAIKYGWLRAILFLIASLLVTGIGQAISLIVIAILFGINLEEVFQESGSIIKNLGAWGYFIVTLFGFLLMLFIAWIFRKFIDKKSFLSLGFAFKNYKKDFFLGMIWGIGLIAFGFVVLILLGNLSIDSIHFDLLTILGYIFMFFVVSLNEEIMVRGYILNNFSQSVNKYTALILTSVIFGVLHLANANISVLGFINIILAGVLLGIYYIHKQNLWFPIGIHFTWNLFQGPVLGFQVSGNKTQSIIAHSITGNELLTGGEFGFEASLLATLLMILAILIIHFQFKENGNP